MKAEDGNSGRGSTSSRKRASTAKASTTKSAGTKTRTTGASKRTTANAGGTSKRTTAKTSSAKAEAKNGAPEMPPASATPAPSIGPHTEIEHTPPQERLAGHEISQVDAMGLDKRRAVVGGSYSPSLARQATLYGAVLAAVAVIVVGFILLANQLDQPPDNYPDQAPWAQPDAPQRPPSPLQ